MTAPTQSKSWGKQRALLLTDSDNDKLQSPDKLAAIWPMSPSPSATSAAELPPTEYASTMSTASIAEPSDASKGSELDHKLVPFSGGSRIYNFVSGQERDFEEFGESRRIVGWARPASFDR